MTIASVTPHGRTKLEFGGFWMPSYCPAGLRQTTDRGSVLVDACDVTWDGKSKRCIAHYRCGACGFTWSEDDWPAWALTGLGRKDGRAA